MASRKTKAGSTDGSHAPAIIIHPSDNVATAMRDLAAGSRLALDVAGRPVEVMLREDIPAGHKLSLRPIRRGETVRKYGEAIGTASRAVAAGSHVHVHNVKSSRGRGDLGGKKALR